ncbi:folylpolyglutamate synthase [Selaginella moellendorffii]|nr:folylpolyglutamate synthase [Selaginella moellendorffii]|eukprot:XP_002987368.2 folylpolyglutamate synthase [Selaginella moellendorffii]
MRFAQSFHSRILPAMSGHDRRSGAQGCAQSLAMAHRRSFRDAIEILNGLITKKRGGGGAVVDLDRSPSTHDSSRWENHFQLVADHLKLLGLEEPVSKLSVIHVAGTKGKGSTCAFVERILRASGFRTALFTSPHLLDIRERFRLNGEEVSEETFNKYFWWCWDHLQANEAEQGLPMPRLFRFLTILAFKMFTSEDVDVAILEVGLGGRCDATNVVRNPAICGVASLGYDHMEILGNTLAEIATEKAGIFKAGVPAVTVPQPAEALEALKKRALELNIPLEIAPPLETYNLGDLKLGLQGEHQRTNAALAVRLCRGWAERSDHQEHKAILNEALEQGRLPDSYIKGLVEVRWAGRAEIVREKKLSFYLDGAHSPESMEACAKWFSSAARADNIHKENEEISAFDIKQFYTPTSNSRQILLFNCMPKRDPNLLFPPLLDICKQQDISLELAIFVPPYSSYTSIDNTHDSPVDPDLSWQKVLQQHWESFKEKDSKAEDYRREFLSGLENGYSSCHFGVSSAVMPSLPAAIDWLRFCSARHPNLHLQVLVTGSLYLVGDVLRLLK